MKKTIILACAALVMSAAAVIGYKVLNGQRMTNLMAANLEALARSEYSSLARNFKSGPIWVETNGYGNITLHYTNPGISFGSAISKYICCLVCADMDGCDFSKEDDICKRVLPRPAN